MPMLWGNGDLLVEAAKLGPKRAWRMENGLLIMQHLFSREEGHSGLRMP